MMHRCGRLLLIVGATLMATSALADGTELTGDATLAKTARDLTLELSVEQAKAELAKADASDQLLAVERARALIYEGACDAAAAILSRPELSEAPAATTLGAIARGCERSTAGAVVSEDPTSGAWIRFQDDADPVLAPLLFDTIQKSRELFERDLGVTMPRPIRVEIVRDQMALSAMTGLPLSAARTTGTIGIAKWGRVVMVSPRATPKGYAVLDTLAHELTHLALTRGSRDRAPLWLQEGVARTGETGWREPLFFDDIPSADDLALFGIKRNIGPDIDKIGPSIALLPSAEEASITYAKVQSFMRYYSKEAGDAAMPKLLAGFRDVDDPDKIDEVISSVSGVPFSTWSDRWKASLERTGRELPVELRPGAPPDKNLKDTRKRVRLGELLLDRGHADAASRELARGHEAMPREAYVRALSARALARFGKEDAARALVEKSEDVSDNDASWWSMRARLGIGDAKAAAHTAITQAPYDPLPACEETSAPDAPADPTHRAICLSARSRASR